MSNVKSFFKRFSSKAKFPHKTHSDDFCHDIFATSVEDLGDGRIKYGFI